MIKLTRGGLLITGYWDFKNFKNFPQITLIETLVGLYYFCAISEERSFAVKPFGCFQEFIVDEVLTLSCEVSYGIVQACLTEGPGCMMSGSAKSRHYCGCSSVVEHLLAKEGESSNLHPLAFFVVISISRML